MTAGSPPKDSSRSALFASLAASGRVESEKASHLRVAAHWLGPLPIAQKLSPITWTTHRKLFTARKPQPVTISLHQPPRPSHLKGEVVRLVQVLAVKVSVFVHFFLGSDVQLVLGTRNFHRQIAQGECQQQGLRPGGLQLDADLIIFCLNETCQQRCKVLLNDVLLHLPVLHATVWLVLSSLQRQGWWQAIEDAGLKSHDADKEVIRAAPAGRPEGSNIIQHYAVHLFFRLGMPVAGDCIQPNTHSSMQVRVVLVLAGS
ncbi:MAG: hypothetical protein FRX49_05886 [Trebouxia sp. A1-2]|nr:MAG: hypothetical protein FRX49_05886 [Trebouxia sp. A1-2]